MGNARTVDGHIEGERCADEIIASLATHQHGVVSRGQLIEAGVTVGAIDSRLQRGRLIGLRRGVYAVGHKALGDRGRWMGAVLATGAGAALSHRTAAANWDLLDWRGQDIDVTVTTAWRSRQGLNIHRNRISSDEIEMQNGIPTTAVSRTIFDLATVIPYRELKRVFGETETRVLTSRLSIPDLVARYPGRQGIRAIRRLLAARTESGVTRSELEDRFVEFLDKRRLCRPELNGLVEAGNRRFEVDCVWRRSKFAVELDGREGHGTNRAFEVDRSRDRSLTAHGWRVVRVTWRALHEEPDQLEAELRDMLPSTLAS